MFGIGLFAHAQETEEKEWIILTYESQTSPESRELTYAYWVTEILEDEATGEPIVPKPFAIYLNEEQEFGEALSHCLSNPSVPLNREPDYANYLVGIRDSLSNNREMVQSRTNTDLVYGTRIHIKIHVSKIKCRFYLCPSGEDTDPYGDQLAFPVGTYMMLPRYFTQDMYAKLHKMLKEN